MPFFFLSATVQNIDTMEMTGAPSRSGNGNAFGVKIVYEEDGGETNKTKVDVFLFHCSVNGIEIDFEFDPDETPTSEWQALASAIKGKAAGEVCTSESNGGVSISHCDGHVTFGVSKYGYGPGGELTVKVPAVECIDAIRQCAKALQECRS